MRKITGLLALFAAATIFIVTSAQAVVVIDFESLETTNNTVDYVGDSYSEDGFELTNLSPGVGIGAFGTLESRFTGSTALFDDNADGLIRLNQIGDGPFDLLANNIVIEVLPEPDTWLLVGTGIGTAILLRKLLK